MHNPKLFPALGVLVGSLLFPLSSNGAVYHSQKGYRIVYPDNWCIATAEQRQAVGEAAARLMRNMDFSHIDVMIYNPQSDPVQNINVVVSPELVPHGPEGVAEVEHGLREQLSSAGIAAKSFECKYLHVGNYDAICTTWVASYGANEMHQRQFIIAGQVRSFIITCSAGPGNFADAEPIFAQILSSFQIVDEPSATPGEWWDGLPPAARDAIVGGGIGLGITVLGSLSKLGKKKA